MRGRWWASTLSPDGTHANALRSGPITKQQGVHGALQGKAPRGRPCIREFDSLHVHDSDGSYEAAAVGGPLRGANLGRARRRAGRRFTCPTTYTKDTHEMLAPTPCLEPGCGDHAKSEGRCQAHQRPRWEGSTRKARLPKDWATRRLIVLRRDHGICHICNEAGADTIDHKVPNDNHELDNLAPVHDRVPPHCHRYKSSQEGHEAKAANKIKRRY